MTRLLFIVNEHPDEAFAISAARETARQLQSQGFRLFTLGKDSIPAEPQGNEIVWAKVRPEDTLLGTVIRKAPTASRYNSTTAARLDDLRYKIAEKIIAENRTEYNYSFHCTQQGHHFGGVKRADFTIEPRKGQKKVLVVEIKAAIRDFPEQLRKRIDSRISKSIKIFFSRDIFTKTTSQQLSRQAGLTPEEYGKAIARKIMKQIALKRKIFKYREIRGRIKRRFKASKQREPTRISRRRK